MIIPQKLNQGDKVALIATARHISESELLPAVKIIENWGLKIVYGKNIYKKYNQFAGTENQRAADLQKMLDHQDIKAIFCVRGGYGTVKIIDSVDFNFFLKYPKWIVGYSDITVLHNHINNLGIATLHATMPINFFSNTKKSLDATRRCLFEVKNKVVASSNLLNRFGQVEGEIVGGNLSVIYSLLGSDSDLIVEDKILFIEDLDEYLYHVDRMTVNLLRNKKFSSIKALIVGSMTKMNDNPIPFGKTANQIISDSIMNFDFPVCFDFPSGHLENNNPIIFGKLSRLCINESGIELLQ